MITQADLRSDTITKPSVAMLECMREAVVGDDCYGDDPSVNALEEYCADLFGKEAALFTCSGTMSNQIALRALTKPGDEVIIEQNYHINFFESGATANLAQVVLNPIRTMDGLLTPDLIQAAIDIKPRSPLYSNPRVICLENSMAFYGGTVLPLATHAAIRQFAIGNDLKIHTDGARILNACIATGQAPREFGAQTDTLSLCFSKGLGAPFGSILVGDKDVIDRARLFRKWYGGGLHQSGFMAAAALFGLKNNVARLAQDHENAKIFHRILQSSGILPPVQAEAQTNIVLFDISGTGLCSRQFVEVMGLHGVRLFPWPGQTVRAITHQDVSAEQVVWAAGKIVEVARRLLGLGDVSCALNVAA